MLRLKWCLILAFGFVSSAQSSATSPIWQSHGWHGFLVKAEPFDKYATKLTTVSKGKFTVKCGWINMKLFSGVGFDSFNWRHQVLLKIDEEEPESRDGRWGTYGGTSDLVTDDRYFNIPISQEDVNRLREASKIALAAKVGDAWYSETVDLKGFSEAYTKMCGE